MSAQDRVNQFKVDYFQFVNEFVWRDSYSYTNSFGKLDFAFDQNLTTKILRSKISENNATEEKITQKQIQDTQNFNVLTTYKFTKRYNFWLKNSSEVISEQVTHSEVLPSQSFRNSIFAGFDYFPFEKIKVCPKITFENSEQKNVNFGGFIFGGETEIKELSVFEKNNLFVFANAEKGKLKTENDLKLDRNKVFTKLEFSSNEDFITNFFAFTFGRSEKDYLTNVDSTIKIETKNENELTFQNLMLYKLTKNAFWNLKSDYSQTANLNVDKFALSGNLSLNYENKGNKFLFGGEIRLEESEFKNSSFKNRDEIIKLSTSGQFKLTKNNLVFTNFSSFKDTYKQLPNGNADRDELEFVGKIGETFVFNDFATQTVSLNYTNFTKKFVSSDYSIDNYTDQTFALTHFSEIKTNGFEAQNSLLIQAKQTVYEFKNAKQTTYSTLDVIPLTLERKLNNETTLNLFLNESLKFNSRYKISLKEGSFFEKNISQKRNSRRENELLLRLEKSFTKSLVFAPFVNIFTLKSDKFLWLEKGETDATEIYSKKFRELKIKNLGPGVLVSYNLKNVNFTFQGRHYKSETKRLVPQRPLVVNEDGSVNFVSSKSEKFNTEIELALLWSF
ncbi:hypothetical protein IT568_03020 [bacterium]|nr:hypothetical protein [bacterium]